MARYRNSRVIPITLILIVVAVAIAALVSVGRVAFFSGDLGDITTQIDKGRESLLNTSLDHSVKMHVRGEVVADEDYRSYDVVVTPTSRTLTVYQGYVGKKIQEKKYSNSTQAYEQFVYALQEAGLVDGRELSDEANDTRGLCADGSIYSFDIISGRDTVENVWTSSCRNLKGSLNASAFEIRDLFLSQISGGKELVRRIDL